MHKGYGSCLVCLFVCVCPSVCLSVTALAASAYVYTVASLIHPMHKYMSGCMHLHQKWAEFPLPGSCLAIGLSFQHKLIHPGNYLYLAESELQVHRGKLSVIRQQLPPYPPSLHRPPMYVPPYPPSLHRPPMYHPTHRKHLLPTLTS